MPASLLVHAVVETHSSKMCTQRSSSSDDPDTHAGIYMLQDFGQSHNVSNIHACFNLKFKSRLAASERTCR